jgi:hypothetical protein
LFANCFSPEGERYQSVSLPYVSTCKWYDITLWLNSEIKIGGKPVLYQHWAKANVFFINDLLKNEGGFLSLEQFQDKYGIISNRY